MLITGYLVIYVIYPGSGNTDTLKQIIPLSKKQTLVTADDVQAKLLGNSGCTVMGFFKVIGGDRTSKSDNPFTPILYIENNWYFEIAHAPSGKDHASAQLRVKTSGGTIGSEMIELPPMLKQKWVCVTILREGRRFDILYDNKIVASQRLENYPVMVSSPLMVGNDAVKGSVVHVIINNTRLSPNDVERERLTHVDTNNVVLEENAIDFSLPVIKLTGQCIPGLPCDPITKPPNNNLFQWKSPYA